MSLALGEFGGSDSQSGRTIPADQLSDWVRGVRGLGTRAGVVGKVVWVYPSLSAARRAAVAA